MMVLDNDRIAAIDALFRRYIQDDAPGAVLAVLNGSEVVLERAYGLADLAHTVPLDSRSIIRIGSQTKQFLVYVVLQLAREGRLSLDDRVGDHLSWPPATVRALRLRGLAANTSGVRDLLDLMVLAGICALGPVSRALEREVIGLSQELAAGEDEDLLYSNSNFLLLTDVVEAAAGAPFAELLSHYLSPLGMTETYLLSRDDEWIPRLAGQYRRGPEGRFLRGSSLAAIGGEGGAVSTLSDMVKWVRHLRAGHLAGDSIVQAMERTTTLGNGTPSPYGLGLVHTRHGGVEEIGHGGSVVGARSESTRFPAQDLAIVLLANREDLPVFALVRQILDILLRRPAAAELPDALRASIASLSGQWREQEGGRVLALDVNHAGATMTTSMGPAPLAPRGGDVVAPLMALPPLAVQARRGDVLRAERWGRAASFVRVRPGETCADPRGNYRAEGIALEARIEGEGGDFRIRLTSPFGLCRVKLTPCDVDLFLAAPDEDTLHGRWLVSPWNAAWLFSLWLRPDGLVLNSDQTAKLVFKRV